MKIVAIGTGYVGLVTGTCFAENGTQVVCVDVDESKIASLKDAKIPFYEPGLEELVKRNIEEKRLHFTSNLKEALEGATAAFICVGTPSADDGSASLKYVFNVVDQVAEVAPQGLILITKSTVPVGTGDRIESRLHELNRPDVHVVSNPEFLREGSAVQDCLFPDRVVIGTEVEEVIKTLNKLYKPFVRTGKPIFTMARRSSEMCKYGANALLACRISFINEISRLCEKVGADIEDVRRAMGADRRIGMQYLFPSVGFGGSCFPKDVRALHFLAKEQGMNPHLLEATLDGNEEQKDNFVRKVLDYFGGKENAKGKKIAVWGLAFKAKTDDIRESPALHVIDGLLEAGVQVMAHDPEAMPNTQKVYQDRVQFMFDMYDALQDADALCVLTEWNNYRTPNFEKVKESMKTKVIFDGRNLYDPSLMEEREIEYFMVGQSLSKK